MDWSEIIAGTGAEMNRLGWSTEQGREYLEETYGVRSRQLLTDNQLVEFWEYLKAQTIPACLRCKSENVEDRVLESGPHYAQRFCLDCGFKAQFLPKPQPENHSPTRKNKNLLNKIKKGFCHICMRKESELPGRVCLEAHHIVGREDGAVMTPATC